jgi:hypothetical protein
MSSRLAAALLCATPQLALAHDQWANGSPLPAWIKTACCGPQEVHHLKPEQVHRLDNGDYQVDGYPEPIPASETLPTQDGDYWIFYRDDRGQNICDYEPAGDGSGCHPGTIGGVLCFFVPTIF